MPIRPSIRSDDLVCLSIGNAGVGKSCLIKRYCEEKFVPRYISTIGVDFGVRAVPSGAIPTKVHFFDLSGKDEYRDVRSEFYTDTSALLLVYDVTNRKSFQALDRWMREATQHGCTTRNVFVCANKTDCTKQARQVTEAEGNRWAQQKGFRHVQVSAQSGLHVQRLFADMFAACAKNA